MKFNNCLYWFCRNLIAFILVLIISPYYWLCKIVYSIMDAIRILFIFDGSDTIAFPNEWDWFVNDPTVKTVYTSVGGTVTAVAIVPESLNPLSFSGYKTPNDYIFIDDLLETKYGTIASKIKGQKIKIGLDLPISKTSKDISAITLINRISSIPNEEQVILLKLKSLLNHLSYIIKDEDKKIIEEYQELCRKYCFWGEK